MGAVTSLFVRKVVKAAGQAIDADAVLTSVGLDPQGDAELGQMISDAAYYDMLERIAGDMGGGWALPVQTGASMNCDDYGAFGLAWKTAPTLRASFARAERYWRLLTSVTEYELRQEAEGAWFLLHRAGLRRLGLCMSNEASLASVLSIIRQVCPVPFTPLEVRFQHPAPQDVTSHESYFGCTIEFESDRDGLLLPAEALTRRNKMGDEAITRFLLPHLDAELKRLQAERTLTDMVHDAVAGALSEGIPKMPAIARRLGMSERTLQRRLSDEGLSFQALVDSARRELAEGLLLQSDYSLAEVAFLTGFSEQSAFTRAFKRWSDQTPAAYRDAQRA
ncbi:AraC family transcriptional regulator [Nioella aestuarii]|uniref:AraC family transcriptional regulator n=1 Tax=Nioella aestuarii TaxID=1662864 RepID=UPI003D7FB714